VVTVAHRFETISGADEILLMEKGEVVNQGSPVEVLDFTKVLEGEYLSYIFVCYEVKEDMNARTRPGWFDAAFTCSPT
jgi:ABC-type glutathione transport system ATPase component